MKGLEGIWQRQSTNANLMREAMMRPIREVPKVAEPYRHQTPPKASGEGVAKRPIHPDLAPASVLPKPHELPALAIWGIPMDERNKSNIHSDFKKMSDVFSGLKDRLGANDSTQTTAESVKNWLKGEWARDAGTYSQQVKDSTHYKTSDWWRSEDRSALVRWIGSITGRDQFAKDVDKVSNSAKELDQVARAKIQNFQYQEQAKQRTEDWNRRLSGARGVVAPSFDELETMLSQKDPGKYAEREASLVAAARDGTVSYDQLGELSKIALRSGNVAESMLLSQIQRNLEDE